MKKTIVLALSLTYLVSYAGLNYQEDVTSEVVTTEFFGDSITKEGAIEMSELATLLETADSANVKVTGTVNSVCKKKGCWMTMSLTDSIDMRVGFKDYGFFVPLNCENRIATIEGVVKKDIISVADLKHYAEDNGDSQEEIDAIVAPKVEYSFVANGVILE